MRLVIDANIIFAALIKRGTTRALLTQSELHTPAFVQEEIQKYLHFLCEKTGLSNRQLERLIEKIFGYITIVPAEAYEHIKVRLHDEKDVPYVALALLLDCPLWSNDQELKEPDYVRVLTTRDILEL